ncbi:Ku protein [Streptomyces albofaciens JCM 4342]|uniref:non-homologous end joining protein Ku n=1 Tax=Streptomyces albofaciens TaxID=66866 RepID=UPI001238B30D|nr:Ku protein [Streptomyces albofaciens]KAA6224480.1 Ku protein [Streptomyces albofaciens JCM 4342]
MARAIWSGSLSFGLVSLPVRMYSATESHTVHFHQIQRGTSDRVRNRRVNERTGKEVPAEEIVKGVDVGDGYVLVEPEELDDIAPGRSKALEIGGFVDLDAVEPVYFATTYYLGPRGKDHAKVYALLHRALQESNKAGIATFVMRNRAYLVAVKAEADILALHTLHWADEIRDPYEEIGDLPGRTKIPDRELRTAVQLIEALSTAWRPEDYHDTYQEQVRGLIEAKRKGETVEKSQEPPESTNVVDLMSALQASVDSVRGTKKGKRGKESRATGRRRDGKRTGTGTGKSRSGGTGRKAPRPEDLTGLNKAELYERATEAGVPGRSSMTRDELLDALSGSGGRSHAKAS